MAPKDSAKIQRNLVYSVLIIAGLGGAANAGNYHLTIKSLFMKTVLLFLALSIVSFGSLKKCSAQPPQWVKDLAIEVLTIDIGSITLWEEKQRTWYNIDGQLDQSDSVTVNTLIIKGTTTAGHFFISAIPVTSGELDPIGERSTTSETCTGECGCQKCEFRYNERGCNCGSGANDCVQQSCSCWCRHTVTSLN